MMKKLLNLKTILLAVMVLGASACKNPTTDIKVTVDMNIMKYSALVRVTDNNGMVIPGVTLAVSGTNAASVYEISGKKNFTVKDGIVTLGLDPAFNINGGNAAFAVTVSAPGYKSFTQNVTFTKGTLQQTINLGLAPTISTSPGGTYTPPVPPKTSTRFVLDFNGRCANKSNLNVRPSLYLFFRESTANNSNPFVMLGYMENGHIETDYLALGKKYDFQITYAGESYTVTQTIDVASYTLTFDMGTSICNSF
ncbi:carboxypeptidase-like regulatory domain-containing protein [Mucilaginibacter myungsuensis]|uniref:Carboxypeptidase regulatory-like domain-containing protein n=1 Tax=Mucilaginibacter myungsuensis TaxID=649104 RepID=A0A929KYQ2_9SPHI|nr:carboxypeptidase-like regulatory domain-containing protein [Mucilaginibacter myungsuensis]MBE9662908.1 hypothetical protein [Mucilaginibacter myungsuensis]MDN3598528.1 carboxypeptidase-like regulatory domain-containing protein [Mucilaginibacter myungsuensis]